MGHNTAYSNPGLLPQLPGLLLARFWGLALRGAGKTFILLLLPLPYTNQSMPSYQSINPILNRSDTEGPLNAG